MSTLKMENNRISHRQLFMQITMAFLPPFLLCLYRPGLALGVNGILGTVTAVAGILFYGIFVIRLTPFAGNPGKTAGRGIGWMIGLFFCGYIVLTGAYLVKVLGEIVPQILTGDVSGKMLSLAAVAVCSVGAHRGMQKRGRVAEVSGRIWLAGMLLMLLICLFQGKSSYFQEIFRIRVRGRSVMQRAYGIWCAFSGISLLPFSLEYVDRRKSVVKAVLPSAAVIGVCTACFGLILPAVFGQKRLLTEAYPVLPLLAGANLPGKVLMRFDVLWLGFLLYGMLFSLGSLCHYGHLIIQKVHLPSGKIWLPVMIWGVSVLRIRGMGVKEYYMPYLKMIFVPGVLLIQIVLFLKIREKWRKKASAITFVVGVLCFCGILGGCVGIEPEKRLYPLALGVDVGNKGALVVTYGVPELPKAEGQTKSEEGNRALCISGENFEEISRKYVDTQEKYLDLGHLQMLVLGDSVSEQGRWEEVLRYLREERMAGEDLYVFAAENAGEVLNWQGDQGTSVGEYVKGLLENHPGKVHREVPSLRAVYHEWYESGKLLSLPQLKIQKEGLQIRMGEG